MKEGSLDHAIIIDPLPVDEGGGFLARVPDLPGCYTDVETPEAALAAARGAIREWLEEVRRLGRVPPVPRSYALAG